MRSRLCQKPTTRLENFYCQSSLTNLVQKVQANPTQGSIQVADRTYARRGYKPDFTLDFLLPNPLFSWHPGICA